MQPFPHHYDVRLVGGSSGYAQLATPGAPPLAAAPPPQFDGPGDAWSPEHLLLASVEACFLFTLRAVARHAKVPFHALEVDATGTVVRIGGVTRFSEIVLRPTITVDARTSDDVVLRLLAKTEHDSREDFADGYDFDEAFCRPFLPSSKQMPHRGTTVPAPDIKL